MYKNDILLKNQIVGDNNGYGEYVIKTDPVTL